jgi:hypothetical protein
MGSVPPACYRNPASPLTPNGILTPPYALEIWWGGEDVIPNLLSVDKQAEFHYALFGDCRGLDFNGAEFGYTVGDVSKELGLVDMLRVVNGGLLD